MKSGIGEVKGRTDLSVNILELVFDACELLVGHLRDLVALVGHFCGVVCLRDMWWRIGYDLCIAEGEEETTIKISKKSFEQAGKQRPDCQ